MLSQINAARGDDGMQVDEDSEDESENEVRQSPTCTVIARGTLRNVHFVGGGGGVLHSWFNGVVGIEKKNSSILDT